MTVQQCKDYAIACAVEFVRREQYEIIELHATSMIDFVAWDRQRDTIVFFRVKYHRRVSFNNQRIFSRPRIDKHRFKMQCTSWRRTNRWQGSSRFDVVHVYDNSEGKHLIVDHLRGIK